MDIPVVNIAGIEFSPMSDDKILECSSGLVDSPDSGESNESLSSLGSLVFGSNSSHFECYTCLNTKKDNSCPGHSGHIKLNTFVPNTTFISEIINYLKIFCFNCGGLITGTEDTTKSIRELVDQLNSSLKKGYRCRNIKDVDAEGNDIICNELHPFIVESKTDKSVIIMETYQLTDDKKPVLVAKKELFPREIFNIFSKIRPNALRKLKVGSSIEPKKFINSLFYVPPNAIRANSSNFEENKSQKNDINVHLNSILKKNREFGDIYGTEIDEVKYRPQIRDLIREITNLTKKENGSETQIRSIFELLSGKKGLVRGNILGFRAYNVARNFIGNDRFARFDMLIIPQAIAEKLFICEVVCDKNRDYLAQFILAQEYPRCIAIIKKSGITINTQYVAVPIVENGDTIIRNVVDDDVVGFCRQPSLLKSNVAGMRIKVSKTVKLFKFNVIICIANGSDFDGDEMNIFGVHNKSDSFELDKTAGLKELLMSNGRGTPLLGQVQDSTIGLALLTRDSVILPKKIARTIFENVELYPNLDKESYTGRDILSELFRVCNVKIDYFGKSRYFKKEYNPYRSFSKTEIEVKIIDGIFHSGIIDKNAVGTMTYGGINHKIYIKYGAQKCMDLMWYMQQIAIQFLIQRGLTVSLADYDILRESVEEIKKIEEANIAQSLHYSELLFQGKIIPPTGKTIREWYEIQQMNILHGSNKFDELILRGIDYDNNNMYNCVNFGSKGDTTNFNEIVSSCGQAVIDDERLPRALGERSSPFFCRDDPDPRARGYTKNSYALGLTPSDVLNTAQSARDGLISKALATAKSGILNREAICSTESMVVDNLRRVRNGNKIRQFLYGGDGMDPRMTYKSILRSMNEDLENYRVIEEEYKQLVIDKTQYIELRLNYEHRTGELYDSAIYLPINFMAIIEEVRHTTDTHKAKITETTYQKIKKFINGIPSFYFNTGNQIPEFLRHSNLFFQMYLRFELCLKNLEKNSFTEYHVDLILEKIRAMFVNSLEDPGASIGYRAVQGILEITTQSALSAIHGKGENKLENFKNFMYAKRTEKILNPTMRVFFKPEYEINEEFVKEFALNIEMTKLRIFITRSQIFFESFANIIHPDFIEENNLIKEHAKIFIPPNDLLPWCIRFEFSIETIIAKKISCEAIVNELIIKFPNCYFVLESMSFMRVYFRQNMFKRNFPLSSLEMKNIMLTMLDTSVRGVDGITSAFVRSTVVHYSEKNTVIEKKIYFIFTEGVNLDVVLFKAVDEKRIRANTPQDMTKLIGITGARNIILDGLRDSVFGAYYAHYTVFADQISCMAEPTGLNRGGSTSRGSTKMTLIADSSWMLHVKKAASKNIRDYISGPNSSIISGAVPEVGTFYNGFELNERFLKEKENKKAKILEDL